MRARAVALSGGMPGKVDFLFFFQVAWMVANNSSCNCIASKARRFGAPHLCL